MANFPAEWLSKMPMGAKCRLTFTSDSSGEAYTLHGWCVPLEVAF